MNKKELMIAVVALLIGVIMASQVRRLPVLNKLPSA